MSPDLTTEPPARLIAALFEATVEVVFASAEPVAETIAD